MAAFPLALVCGFFAGFFGAIPPGPLGITCLRKSLLGETRAAYRVAFGGASVDFLICALIGFGLGWVLERFVTNPWVRAPLALVLLVLGVKILVVDARRDEVSQAADARADVAAKGAAAGRLPFLIGFLQGAANPAPVVNWTLFISFLIGHRLLDPSPAGAGGFALGVGLGVFTWFSVLIKIAERFRDRAGAWIQRSTIVAGLVLVAFGLYFTWRSFVP